MSVLTERLSKEILAGIEDGYVQSTPDTYAFLKGLQTGEDIIKDFVKPTEVGKGGQPDA